MKHHDEDMLYGSLALHCDCFSNLKFSSCVISSLQRKELRPASNDAVQEPISMACEESSRNTDFSSVSLLGVDASVMLPVPASETASDERLRLTSKAMVQSGD
jgi:hypothetical protein